MNAFYKKLTKFGALVYTSSHSKKLDMSNYFTVEHPAFPVVKNSEKIMPNLLFIDNCPHAIKAEVAVLWDRVFGKQPR